jgi:hypothetical protein
MKKKWVISSVVAFFVLATVFFYILGIQAEKQAAAAQTTATASSSTPAPATPAPPDPETVEHIITHPAPAEPEVADEVERTNFAAAIESKMRAGGLPIIHTAVGDSRITTLGLPVSCTAVGYQKRVLLIANPYDGREEIELPVLAPPRRIQLRCPSKWKASVRTRSTHSPMKRMSSQLLGRCR